MSEKQNKTIQEKIIDSLSEIRQYIQNDGGDLQFKEFKDGILTIQVLGHCVGCASFDITFTSNIKPLLMNEYPEIKDVIFETKKTVW